MLKVFPKIVCVFALCWKWSKVLKQTIYSCFSQYFHYWNTYSTANSFPPVLVEHCVFICCSVKNFLKIHIVFNPVFGTLSEINFVLWSLSDFVSPHLTLRSSVKKVLENERFCCALDPLWFKCLRFIINFDDANFLN